MYAYRFLSIANELTGSLELMILKSINAGAGIVGMQMPHTQGLVQPHHGKSPNRISPEGQPIYHQPISGRKDLGTYAPYRCGIDVNLEVA